MSWSDPTPELRELDPLLRELRHDLHRHPELGFEERRSQARVRDFLQSRGYQPQSCAGTGLIADLHPERHGRAPTIALRADLDALPIDERTDLPHRSVHPGVSHKCGHDGHTAILLGVADLLARHRGHIDGNVRLLFQPAEEGVRGGGAAVMLAEGALDGVAEIYGLHNWPGFPKGQLHIRPGVVMAQVTSLDLRLRGVGGHGSQPQRCRDPIVAGAHLIAALQTVVARDLGADGGAVVSITAFQAGNTHNVIPESAHLRGTIRAFDRDVHERVLRRVRELVEGNARGFGVEADLQLIPGYPLLVNHPECAAAVARVGRQLLGEAAITSAGLPIAGGEDFAYFTGAVPGAYFFLGAGRPGQDTPGCHHPDFDFDDDLIPRGAAVLLGLVRERLPHLLARPGGSMTEAAR